MDLPRSIHTRAKVRYRTFFEKWRVKKNVNLLILNEGDLGKRAEPGYCNKPSVSTLKILVQAVSYCRNLRIWKFNNFHFWPGLGLPRPKAIVVIPKINSCQTHLRKKTSESATYPWPLRYKKKDPLK